MKALYAAGAPVPLSRVLQEHRAALIPLGIVLAINIAVLVGMVLPMSRNVAANEDRARAAERAQAAADAEFKQAEALRDGKAQATTDLDMFYKQVLPTDVAAARRITHSRLVQLAEAHNIRYERLATNADRVRESSLERLALTMTLSGDYDDIRAFIYQLETAPDFVVIDNLVLEEGLDANALSLSLELSTYFRSARLPATRSNNAAQLVGAGSSSFDERVEESQVGGNGR